MLRALATSAVLAAAVVACGGSDGEGARPSKSPYAGLEQREIKALSRARVADLLAGTGGGYALAAELNHYPGPMHVLELADMLALTREQERSVRALEHSMHERGKQLGRRVVRLEAELDQAFRSATIDSRRVGELTALIARLEGELRRVHLEAHLRTRAVLSAPQVAAYDRLRGYRAGAHAGRHGEGHGRR